ncbi:MAG: class I SAM-dependent methyltransferase [Candidatus Bathyarchaeota archaeon]|nr:class I SAM-dependent methyltransferase [Candidatus Bathyarchaeota archaeon]
MACNFQEKAKQSFDFYQKDGLVKHQFKSECSHPFHRQRYAVLVQILGRFGEGTMLDIGCAEGWFTKWAVSKMDTVVGVDISVPRIRKANCEAKGNSAHFVVATFDKLPFKEGVFETVIWSEGPEHSVAPKIALNEVSFVTKNSGIAIFTTMGLWPPLYYQELRKLFGAWSTEVSEWEKWGHYSIFTKKSFIDLLSSHFEVITSKFIRPPIVLPLISLQVVFDQLTYKLTGRFFGSGWPGFGCVFVVGRKPA